MVTTADIGFGYNKFTLNDEEFNHINYISDRKKYSDLFNKVMTTYLSS